MEDVSKNVEEDIVKKSNKFLTSEMFGLMVN